MSSKSSYPPSSVEFLPSRALAWLVLALLLACLAVDVSVRLAPAWGGVVVLLQFSAARAAMDWCLLRLPGQPRRLVGHPDGRWTLVLNDGTRIDACWRPGFLAVNGIVAGSMRGEGHSIGVLAVPWNTSSGSRRRLAVRLRWMPGEELWEER